jgi:hypothetical protein
MVPFHRAVRTSDSSVLTRPETYCEKSPYTALHTTRESVREKFLRLLYQTRKPTEGFEHKIGNQTEFGRRGGKNNFEKLRLIRAG